MKPLYTANLSSSRSVKSYVTREGLDPGLQDPLLFLLCFPWWVSRRQLRGAVCTSGGGRERRVVLPGREECMELTWGVMEAPGLAAMSPFPAVLLLPDDVRHLRSSAFRMHPGGSFSLPLWSLCHHSGGSLRAPRRSAAGALGWIILCHGAGGGGVLRTVGCLAATCQKPPSPVATARNVSGHAECRLGDKVAPPLRTAVLIGLPTPLYGMFSTQQPGDPFNMSVIRAVCSEPCRGLHLHDEPQVLPALLSI